MLIRVLSKRYSTNQLLFWYFFIASIIAGLAALFSWKTPDNGRLWLLLLGIGIFGTTYQVFATLSYTKAPVRLMAPFMFLATIFGGLFDWLFWQQAPSLMTFIGMILVIAGTTITIYFGQRAINSTRPPQQVS